MLVLLLVFGLASLLVPFAARRLGLRVFPIMAVVPLAAFAHTAVLAPAALSDQPPRESVAWVPQLALAFDVRLDALSWLLALVVTGVGALVIVYCVKYFAAGEHGIGRFAAVLLAFTGSMYGLAVSDNVFLLYLFWEATTVFSYLLIGHYTGRRASRGAALQALIVTTAGGLAMLVGLVILTAQLGTSRLSEMVELAPQGNLITGAVILVLLGALSKSAIFPFHSWLPAAMAAPTPVSAYLHAAAMVQAGIYLVAKMAPGFSTTPGWRELLLALGLITMLHGGWRALGQFDLKLLLAHGTVSQLGFLLVVVSFGTRETALAGLALFLAHALFKASLFLVVGIVDHRAGTRDLRKLSGLGREAPFLAATATIAVLSMVGFPLTAGFVAKEAVLAAFLEAGTAAGWVALVGVALGSVLTVAYSARFVWGAFARKRDVERVRPVEESVWFLMSPALLAVAGIVIVPFTASVDSALSVYAGQLPASTTEGFHLAAWHGFEPALAISAFTLAAGLAMFWARRPVAFLQSASTGIVNSSQWYWQSLRVVDRVAAKTTASTQRGSLPFYLGVILLVLVGAVGATLAVNRTWPDQLRLWDNPAQLAVAGIMAVAALALTRADKRFQAALLVGVTGYGMSALFAFHGAPDLALTQVLVETVTLIAFVLVLRRLPARLGHEHGTVHRGLRAVIGVAIGLMMAVVSVVALGARTASPISLDLPQLAFENGFGVNVVNVILVDVRGWDTLGELSVLIAAATGVASLVFLRSRTDNLPRVPRERRRRTLRARTRPVRETVSPEYVPGVEQPSTRDAWLLAGRMLAPENRSILLEVMVRLLFHAIVVLSVYILFAGHNAPGGGFAGGLVAGLALAGRYLAGGRYELGAATPVDAGKLLGVGLFLAAGTAAAPLLFGANALSSTLFQLDVPVFGHLELVTSTVFDIGVYLVVVGMVLDVLRSLGAEVDRQQEDASDALTEGSTI